MKKKLFSLSVIVICLAIMGYGVIAYFTDVTIAHNVITSGGVDVEIVETQTGSGPSLVEGISGVMPGGEVVRTVTVENQEKSSESWIRVWLNIAITEQGDPILNPTVKNLPLSVKNALGEDVDVVTLDISPENWILGDDGYYYYKSSVEPEHSTAPLFTTIRFATEMGNEYQNCKVLIDISVEAVQTANNPIPDGGDVTDIVGWPEP